MKISINYSPQDYTFRYHFYSSLIIPPKAFNNFSKAQDQQYVQSQYVHSALSSDVQGSVNSSEDSCSAYGGWHFLLPHCLHVGIHSGLTSL